MAWLWTQIKHLPIGTIHIPFISNHQHQSYANTSVRSFAITSSFALNQSSNRHLSSSFNTYIPLQPSRLISRNNSRFEFAIIIRNYQRS
eukprot:28606_1